MGVIGVGSICASYGLAWVKDRFDANQLYAISVIGTVGATVMFGAAHGPALAFAASFVGGASSVVAITVLFMSMQVSLPEWVRGRGLAVFLTVYFGALTVGSALWGKVASLFGVPMSLYASAACTLVGLVAAWPWKLQTTATQDLTPSLHWNKPAFNEQMVGRRGPILVTVEYQIDPKDREPFLALMQEIGRERQRDGAFAWNVFESPAGDGRMIETSLLASYQEFEYARARVSKADLLIQVLAQAYLKALPKVEFLVAAKRLRKPWTRFRAEKSAY